MSPTNYMYSRDVAQICRAGHVITGLYNHAPSERQDFCSRCGQSTITACELCSAPLAGLDDDDLLMGGRVAVPAYCSSCGNQLPWSKAREDADNEKIDLIKGLGVDQKANLKQDIRDIRGRSPRHEVAVTRIKLLLGGVKGNVRDLVVDVLATALDDEVKHAVGL